MMITTSRLLRCLSLVSIVIFAVMVSECSSQHTVWDPVHASIKNDIARGVELNAWCKSKNTDFGHHIIAYADEFVWNFKINFWNTTLYWCKMWWTDVDGKYTEDSYAIYKAKRDWDRCENECHYSVRRDGIYQSIHGTDAYDLVHSWGQK
ncbi:hypothetical protein MKX03_021413 [Papaver bracteatum]|nr:hypothetical protein MKX03_023438 [Papaver bracteatum]KAI3872291.1 hypothetical protein MKX03_021413 [Papaver bracteatum]